MRGSSRPAATARRAVSVALACGLSATLAGIGTGWAQTPAVNAIAIATGIRHTCALTSRGAVKCWGYNSYGQVGNGTEADQAQPVDVIGLADPVRQVAAGGYHTCALTLGGAVKCWGSNYDGELGDGTQHDRPAADDAVGLGSGVVALAGGGYHMCALTAGGAVKCWGYNHEGQLGDGSTKMRLTATDVSGLGSGVKAIAAGFKHSCAITAAGAARCWGANGSGQLGDGTTTDRPAPVDVTGLASDVVAIAAGGEHTCALTGAGAVKCWGGNANGALGDGTTASRGAPADVTGLADGAVAIAAGPDHGCALTAAGGMKCWGLNTNGVLGDDTTSRRLAPVDVKGLKDGVSAIATGNYHSCALASSGVPMCWGENYAGQVGDGTTTTRRAPVPVATFVLASGAHQGMWWNAPAGSESGWGANLNHQGDTIFVTWFTFGADGKPLWLVAAATRTTGEVYAGKLYTGTGPPFDSAAFDSAMVVPSEVGTVTITAVEGNRVTFAYTVGNVSRSKTLQRQVFGAPVPTCAWGAPADPALATNFQDIWWAAPGGSESGWGINFTHQGATIFGTWFTYGADGKATWMVVGLSRTGPDTYAGKLYTGTGPPFGAEAFDPSQVVATEVGTATVTFTDGNHATFAYAITGGATQSKPITRQPIAPPGTVCQ